MDFGERLCTVKGIGAGDGDVTGVAGRRGAVMVISASEVAGMLEFGLEGGSAAMGRRLMRARRRDSLVPFLDQPWPVNRLRFDGLGAGADLDASGVVSSLDETRSTHSASEMVYASS